MSKTTLRDMAKFKDIISNMRRLQDDIDRWQRDGYKRVTIEIYERKMLGSLRIVERITDVSTAKSYESRLSNGSLSYMGSGYDDDGYPVFQFELK